MSPILVKEMEDQTVKKIKAVMSMTKVKETELMLEIILKRKRNLTMKGIQMKEIMRMATVLIMVILAIQELEMQALKMMMKRRKKILEMNFMTTILPMDKMVIILATRMEIQIQVVK